MKENIVETRNLKKYYQMGENTVRALDGIDFCVKDQEFVAINWKKRIWKEYAFTYARGIGYPDGRGSVGRGKVPFGTEKRTACYISQKKDWIYFPKL